MNLLNMTSERAKQLERICGFGLGFIGTFLVWQSGSALALYLNAGVELGSVLLQPELALRVLTGLAAFLAGMSALTERGGGAWLGGMAAFSFTILIVVLVNGQAVGLEYWRHEAITLIMIAALSLALMVARRNAPPPFSEPFEAQPEPEPALPNA